MRYYLDMRLAAAYQLVTQSGLDLREVALATGFANVCTMSRRFKQQYGKTPSMLRKALAGIAV